MTTINGIFSQGISDMFTLIDQSGVPTDWYTDASSNSTNPGVIDLSNNNNSLGLRFNQNIYQDVSNLTIGSKYRISWNYFTEEGRSGNSLQVYLDNSSIFISTSVYSITPINAFVDFNASKSYHNFKFSVTNDTSDIVYIDDISLKKVNSDGIVLPGLDNINDGYISLDPQPLGSIFTLSTWAKWNDLSNANQYLLNFNDSIKEYPYINKIRVESGSTSTPLNIRELQVWSDGNNVAIPQNSLDYAISSKSIHLKKLRFISTSGIPVQIDDLQVWAYNQNYIDTSNVTITQSSTINLKKLKLQTTHNDSLKVKKLELWVDGINIADNSYNITSQSSIVGENIHFNMIDNDPNTYTETSTATGEYVQLDLSSAISIDTIENIKYFPFEPNSDQSSILQLFDESENILFTFDNSITDVSSYIYQYAGPSYNYNTSNQSKDVLLPYSGDELVFSYNLNYPTTGNYEWLVIKFDANGVVYGVNSQAQLYKNILTTPSSVIYDWTSFNYFHDFTIDKNGNIYFCTQAYSSNNKNHLYKITYDSVNDTYSGNTQSDLNQLTQDSNAFGYNQYGSVWLTFRDPLVLFADWMSNVTTYNVNTNTFENIENYIPVYNNVFGDAITGIAFDSQGNIFMTKRNTSAPTSNGVNVIYKSGTIFGSTVDYSGNPWEVDNIYHLSANVRDHYNQENQHLMFSEIFYCADITIDSNDDIYFSSFGSGNNSVNKMSVIRVDGKTGITNKVVGAGYNNVTGFTGVEWADGIAADQLKGDHTHWTRWPPITNASRLNHGLYWTLDSEGFIWVVGIKNGTKLYKIAKNGEFVNTKFIDLSGYDIVNDQSNNGYTNLDYKRSSGAFGKFLNYRTRNTTTEFLDFTLERSIPINDLQAIVATSVTDPSYNRLYDLFLFDQNNNAIIQFRNSEPAQDYYVYKYTGPDYANYSLGFSTLLSYDQIIDDSANINIPSIGTKGVNSKNLFGDYTMLKRIRIENNGTSSINLRELQVWKDNSNVALDCSSSISNEIFLKRIKIETNDLTPIDDTLKSYISNLDHHIDFANFPSNHFNYLKDIGSSSEKMNATLYGNITKDISGINIPLISESNYVDLSDVSLNGVNTITTWVKFDDLSHHSQVLFDFHNLETINGQQGKTNQLTMLTGNDLDGSENQLLLKVTGDQQPHRLKTIRIEAADNVPITLKELQVWSNDKNISQLEKRRYPPQYINVNTRYIPPNTPIYNWDFRKTTPTITNTPPISPSYNWDFRVTTPTTTNNTPIITPTYNWDFRVDSTTSVTDSIGGLTATYMNSLTSTVENGAYFAGGGAAANELNYINLPSFQLGGNCSFEFYARFDDSATYAKIFDFGDYNTSGNGNAIKFGRYNNNSTLYLDANSGSASFNRLGPSGTIINNTFMHYVITFNSTTVTLYINGTSIANNTSFLNIPTRTRTYHQLGRSLLTTSGTDQYFKGYIKYFRVWNGTALSSSQVTELYNTRDGDPVITDSVGGLTATYKNGLTSDITNGARCLNSSSSYIDLGVISMQSNFSIEVYFKTQIQQSYGTIYFAWAPTTISYGDSNVYPPTTGNTTIDHSTHSFDSSTNNRFHWREYVNGVHTYSQNVEGLNIGKIHMVVSYENGTVKHYINNNLVYTATSTLPAQDFHWILNKSLDVDSFTDRDIYFFRLYNGTSLTSSQVTTLYNAREGSLYITDDIGGVPAIYQNGVTSTVSDGAIFDNIDDSMKLENVSLNPTNGFSSELYLSIDTVTDARSNDWQQIFRLATGSGWNGDNALSLNIYNQSGDSWIPWRASNHSLELRNDFSSTDHNRIYYQADFMNEGLTHIVFTVSSTNVLKMYINNVLKGGVSIKNTGAGQLNSHDFGAIPTVTRTYNHIGATNDTDTDYNPNMKLKYLRFFNQEFSASEVTDLYNNRNNVTNVDVSLNKVIGEQADASASLVVSNQFYGNGTYVFDAVHSINRNSNPYENFGNVQNIFDNIITHHSGGWAAYTSSISSLFGTDYTNTITTETNTGTINDTSSAAFTFKLPQPILLNSFSHTYDGSNNKQTFKNLKVYGFKNESTILPTYNWDFRVASSTTVTDSSASLNATFNGGMSSTLNNGATLDGSNDYINLQGFEFGGTFSIESYFKITNNPASSSKLYYFSNSTYSNAKYIKIDQNGQSLKLNEVQLFQGTTNIAQGKEVRYGQNDSTYANAVTTHLSPPWYGNPTAGAYPSTIADGNQTTAHRDYDNANGNYYITLDDNIDFGTLSAITIRCNDTANNYALPKRFSGSNYRMSLLDSGFNTIWSTPNWIGSNSEYYTMHIASLNSYSSANYDTYRAGNDTNFTKVYNYVPISPSSTNPLFNLSKYSNNNYFAVESIGSGVDSFPVPDALLQLNVWTHIVVTMDGTEIKVYYNGVLVGTRSDANVRTRSFTDTIYLFTDGSSKIQGNIKLFKYWDGKALSASEVTTLYTDKNSFTNTYTQLGAPFTNSSSDTYAHLSYITDNSGVMYDEYKFVYSGTFQTEEAINLTNIDNSATLYDVSSANHYGPNPFSISIGTDDSSGNFFGNSLLLHDSNANNLTLPSKSNLFNSTLWIGKNESKHIILDLGEKKEFNTFYIYDSPDLNGITDVSLAVIPNEPYHDLSAVNLQYSDTSWNSIQIQLSPLFNENKRFESSEFINNVINVSEANNKGMWTALGGISKNGIYAVVGLYYDKKVYYSHDGGNNWNESTININTLTLVRGVSLSKNGKYSAFGNAGVGSSPHIYYSSDYGVTYNYINRIGTSYYFASTFVNEDGTIVFVSSSEQNGGAPLYVGYIDKTNLTNTTWHTITGVGSYGRILSNDYYTKIFLATTTGTWIFDNNDTSKLTDSSYWNRSTNSNISNIPSNGSITASQDLRVIVIPNNTVSSQEIWISTDYGNSFSNMYNNELTAFSTNSARASVSPDGHIVILFQGSNDLYFYKVNENGTYYLLSIVPNSLFNEPIHLAYQSNNGKILLLDNSFSGDNNNNGAAFILNIRRTFTGNFIANFDPQYARYIRITAYNDGYRGQKGTLLKKIKIQKDISENRVVTNLTNLSLNNHLDFINYQISDLSYNDLSANEFDISLKQPGGVFDSSGLKLTNERVELNSYTNTQNQYSGNGLVYPPIAVTGTESNSVFTGTISGHTYGNGTYTITNNGAVLNGGAHISARSMSVFYDKLTGTADPYRYLLQQTDASFTFTFPDNVIIKKMFTHNNHSCGSCDITINNNSVYSGSIDKFVDAYSELNLSNNVELSNTVDVRLYNGDKVYMQNSEFYFIVDIGSTPNISSSTFSIWGKWTNTLSSQTLFEFYNSNITTYNIDGINSIIGNSNYSYSDVRTATRTHSGDSDAFKNGNYKVSLSSDSNFSFSQTSLDFSNNDVSAGDFFESLNFPLDITGTWPNSTANQQLNNAVTAPFVGNIFVRAGGRYSNGERINYIINYNGNFRGRGGRWQRVGNGTPGYPWANLGGGFSYIDHDGSIRRMNTEWTLGPNNNHNASDFVYIELPNGIYAHCTGYFIQNNHASRAFVDFHIFGTANDGQTRVIDYQLNTHVDSNSHPNGYYGVPSQRSKYSFNRFYFAVSRMSTAQAYADFVDYKRIALQLSFGLMDATNYSGTNYTGTVSTNHNSGNVNGFWLQQEFAFEFVPTTIKIVQMSEVNFLVAYATDITVLGSNDGSTWTKITDLTGISSGTTTHNINTSSSFSYYRLVATKSNDDRVIINSVTINGNYEFNQGNIDYFSIRSSEGTGGAFTKIDLDVSGSSTLNTTIKNTDLIQVNKMHHMALTVGTNTKFYFDGTLIATEATPTNIQSTLLRNIHYLGGLGASKEVVISQLSFFGIELTQSNITTLYNLGYSAMYVDKTYSIKSKEIQVWVENNNIASTGTITYSGLKNGDNNTLINSNLSSSDVLITNDISGSYYQLEFPRPVDFSGIQSVVIYNDPTSSYSFNNTKITFIDLFEREIDSLENSTGSTDYNIFKYRGPSHESTIPKIRNIRLETTSQAQLSISEIQIWSNKSNINSPVDRPTNSFILNSPTRSLTDVYSSTSLTLVGNPGFDNDGVHLIGSQYITIPQSILGFGSDDFTISLWTQTSVASGTPHILSMGYNNTNSWLLGSDGNVIQLYGYQQTSTGDGDTDVNFTVDNQATNYIISRVGNKMKLFINRELKLDLDISVSLPAQDYHIGYSLSYGSYYSGAIKRLDIWKGTGF